MDTVAEQARGVAEQARGHSQVFFSSDWLQARRRKLSYIRRTPEETAPYRVVYHYHERLEQLWDDRYSQYYGKFRNEVREAFFKYLDCGILLHGCARACCVECKHTRLIPLSCKCRGVCPSCDTKRMLLFAEHLHEEVLEAVPHRHLVLSIPKMLRAFFRYDRSRNTFLFQAARRAIEKLYSELKPDATHGAVLSLHSGNDLQEFNPHIHGVLADGVFEQDGTFLQLSLEQDALKKLFEHQLLEILRDNAVITETLIAQLGSWKHSGFSAWLGPEIQPVDSEARLFISEYVNKAQLKLSKIEITADDTLFEDDVVRCYKDESTFRDYKPLDFLAQLSALVPNRWEQTVRYIGWYSARSRGKRKKELLKEDPLETSALTIAAEDTDSEYKKKKRKSWARLIRKVFEIDPLLCPKCGGEMKIIAVITDPKEARRISLHLGNQYRAPPALKSSFDKQDTIH